MQRKTPNQSEQTVQSEPPLHQEKPNRLTDSFSFVEVVYDSDLYRQTVQLRETVLRIPLGLSSFGAELEMESDSRHFAILPKGSGENPLAVVVIQPTKSEGCVKLRQMAVAESKRGIGLGRLLVQSVEQQLASDGIRHMKLHARLVAADFYRKMNYDVVGEEFEEVGIPHLKMIKDITNDDS